jgi:hypothetical protein
LADSVAGRFCHVPAVSLEGVLEVISGGKMGYKDENAYQSSPTEKNDDKKVTGSKA